MSADSRLDELLDSVADGDEIDWEALEANADPEMRVLLAHLKTVAGVADVHRTSTDEDETGPVVMPITGAAFALGKPNANAARMAVTRALARLIEAMQHER